MGIFGNPAGQISGSVALRPHLTMGLPFSNFIRFFNCSTVKCLVVEEIHLLVLKRLEEAFHGSIVIRIAFPRHADSEAMPVQFVDFL